jgi:hypothetical protein
VVEPDNHIGDRQVGEVVCIAGLAHAGHDDGCALETERGGDVVQESAGLLRVAPCPAKSAEAVQHHELSAKLAGVSDDGLRCGVEPPIEELPCAHDLNGLANQLRVEKPKSTPVLNDLRGWLGQRRQDEHAMPLPRRREPHLPGQDRLAAPRRPHQDCERATSQAAAEHRVEIGHARGQQLEGGRGSAHRRSFTPSGSAKPKAAPHPAGSRVPRSRASPRCSGAAGSPPNGARKKPSW